MRWFVRGDVDGFFGLALDNLVQLLVINTLCRVVLGFDDNLLYGRVLPGVAVSLLVGNLFYAWQAKRLGDRTGRSDVCALPYGINTPSVFAYIFLVMLPAKLSAEADGATAAEAARIAWSAGLVACFGSGVIEFAGAFVAERIRRSAPRAALLSTLAGIAIGFISLGFLFRTFAHPVVGLTTLAIILAAYFGRVKLRGGVPAGLVAVLVGSALCWATGIAPVGAWPGEASLRLPVPVVGDLFAAMTSSAGLSFLSVIVPMGLFNVMGSLQNIESAEAEGDRFDTAPSLAVNGLGTLAAATFGSCFPTTIYIGHPGWKAMGARAGYSVLNGLFISAICLTGTVAHVNWAVPVDAGMAIVLWIGIVITAQAFTATPPAHAPAVVVGLLPGIGAYGALMMKMGLRVGGYGSPDGPSFVERGQHILDAFTLNDLHAHGAFSLEQGFIFTAMILSAMTVAIIRRRFLQAAAWAAVAAMLSLLGLMHAYHFTAGDTAMTTWLGNGWPPPAGPWAVGYALMALVFASAHFLTTPGED